jgi:hypothetical protein
MLSQKIKPHSTAKKNLRCCAFAAHFFKRQRHGSVKDYSVSSTLSGGHITLTPVFIENVFAFQIIYRLCSSTPSSCSVRRALPYANDFGLSALQGRNPNDDFFSSDNSVFLNFEF